LFHVLHPVEKTVIIKKNAIKIFIVLILVLLQILPPTGCTACLVIVFYQIAKITAIKLPNLIQEHE
jgi:hypothetical protein